MNKTKQMIAALAIVLFGVGGFLVYDSSKDDQANTESNSSQIVEQQQEQAEPTTILTFSEDGSSVAYAGETDKTALEILQANTDITTESSDFGDFVTGINGVEADSNKEYWSFYVNGEYASEGAGTYKTTDGEKIEWKLEQL